MDDQPAELAARLQAEGLAVQAFFQTLLPEQWSQVVYANQGGWRIRELLAHFIAAEQGFQQLIQSIAGGGASVPPDFDIDTYNARSVAELVETDLDVLLSQFAMGRERTVALVRGLSQAQLMMRGRHPALGEATLNEMLRAIYNHNRLHLRDIRLAQRTGQRLAGEEGAAG